MKQEFQKSCSVFALLLAIASLPLTWLRFGFGNSLSGAIFPSLQISNNFAGWSGVKIIGIPVWLTVLALCLAALSQLLSAYRIIPVPRNVQWPLTLVGMLLVAITLGASIAGSNTAPGIGCFVGALSGICTTVGLLFPGQRSSRPEDNSE